MSALAGVSQLSNQWCVAWGRSMPAAMKSVRALTYDIVRRCERRRCLCVHWYGI